METKLVIYQILPRLFGNTKQLNIPNGTIQQNGCGKMSAFTPHVLETIRKMGVNCIWFVGIPEHATTTQYPEANIPAEHPDIVKGRAGSPYAIKDYYDVSPDIADNPATRREEFDNLVKRCHQQGLKVLIDFVPNHVARNYSSDAIPYAIADLGQNDKQSVAFDHNNNFYYIPGKPFIPPNSRPDDESNYQEFPARATGNNCFAPNPSSSDWYETAKLNYGIDFLNNEKCRFSPIPDTWYKMRSILMYWVEKHVDGFRCDMAEMVPVEFWNWVIPEIKSQYPDTIFLAEIYNQHRYHEYFHVGKFDCLYDKSGLYDTIRNVISGLAPASDITKCWQSLGDLQGRMLNFVENHDEQRVASDFFAADPLKARPAFAVAAAINTGPVLLYAGQELGERGMEAEGFSGIDGRTTIFDYWSVSTLRRWYNGGKTDSELLTAEERELQTFYVKMMQICNSSPAIREGRFFDLMYVNPAGRHFNPQYHFAWMRCYGEELVLIVANFDSSDADINIFVPENAFNYFNLHRPVFTSATDMITGEISPAELKRNSSCPINVGKHNAKILRFSYPGT
ncbi:MAG: alpha-amylase family protein [Dysgonamonadaceae bacterium]|jgi:glycosidase|nr:alpha-amylase family protein [Dysgonamonadaceae bacterium]